MERIYIDSNSKLHKVMALRGGISPISNSPVRVFNHPPRSPGFDLRANSNVLCSLENLEPPVVRYYRSGGLPLSSIENLEISPKTMFQTPVKVEEDVIVMDGVLVGPVTASRVRSSSSTSDSGGSSSSGGKSFYKTEICRSWEDFGSCRYGAKCQFAHGKEELRPTRFSNKSKSEVERVISTQMCKSYSSGSGSFGSKCRLSHEQNYSPASGTDSPLTMTSLSSRIVSQNVSPASATDSPVSVISSKTQTVLPIKLESHELCWKVPFNTTNSLAELFACTSKRFTDLYNSLKTSDCLTYQARESRELCWKEVFDNRDSLTTQFSCIGYRFTSQYDSFKNSNCLTYQARESHEVWWKSSSSTQTVSPIKPQNAKDCSESFTFASGDWSPLDDGIEVTLPCSSPADKALSRGEVDAYINSLLYGPSKRRTLPVFAAICPR